MSGSVLTIPVAQTLNVVTLVEALVFAVWFLARPARLSLSTALLSLFFLMLAATKVDELFQMLSGIERFPQFAFVLSPLQALLTPLLFLFVLSRTVPAFRLRQEHAVHLAPALFLTVYLWATWFRHDAAAKAALIEDGGLNTAANFLFVPLIGDAIQLAYIAAALIVLRRYGLSLRGWFANVEDKNLAWMRQVLSLWAGVFAIHAALTIAQGVFGSRAASAQIILILDLAHLLIANLLALQAAAEMAARPASAPALQAPRIQEQKYAGSGLDAAARAQLFARIQNALATERLYLRADLTLGELAHHVAATPREASEAINGAGGMTFFELTNRARIDYAKRALVEKPEARIIDIALESGFNSKSAFHDAFRKYAGETPGAWRRRCALPREAARSGAKEA